MTKTVLQQLLLNIVDEKSVYPLLLLTMLTVEFSFIFTLHCRGLCRTDSEDTESFA